jgi:group II intron reverse transcriptase/maturase
MDKSFDISKRLVWEAYKSVKANQGAAGVDGQSVEAFEADLQKNLYKIWNRMSSGTYFPPPVRAVEIPKPHGGGTRVLGVPTVADRIAQTVVALQLLPRMESIFHGDSYGYRPGRSPLAAVKKCRERCWKKDWVLDLDVQKFFDSVDHELMVKAVEANTDQKWVVLYVKRWLKAPMQLPDGTVVERDRGTPQGSAVSPVLANLYLHYAFDSWLEREFPTVEFERFADDAVVHCVTERQARQVWTALADRLESVGLRLHPDKTKIVYCGDSNRRREFECVSFTFLGYAFRPRESKSGKTGTIFTSFQPAMSPEALKSKSQELRRWRISQAHFHGSARGGRVVESHRARLDELLRRVQQVRDVLSPATHQHLLDALGAQEIQATAHLETVQVLVAWAHREGARVVRSLGMDARVPLDRVRRAE